MGRPKRTSELRFTCPILLLFECLWIWNGTVPATENARYLFVTCQHGAEKACKSELEKSHPELRLAFSRPGFITFKVMGKLPDNFVLKSTFARTSGWSIGKVAGEDGQGLLAELVELVGSSGVAFQQLHVWQRDTAMPGTRGFEPFPTALAESMADQIADVVRPAMENVSQDKSAAARAPKRVLPNRIAKPDQVVLDVILVEPNLWWIGWHVATTVPARWVGGVPPLERDDEVISRAYYKLSEALAWMQVPIRKNDLCIEIGSAPGGATERLLEAGADVFAIDPADMDPSFATEPRVLHVKMRSKDVSKKELSGARWLIADLNVAPTYTLDTVEDFVTNQHLNLRGLVLTLKLTSWELADKLGDCRERVKAWGFDIVKTRQLAFNRREVCLVAVRDRMDIRASRKPKAKRGTPSGSRKPGASRERNLAQVKKSKAEKKSADTNPSNGE